MPYDCSPNAVIAVLGIADLLVTSLGAQGSDKQTGQAIVGADAWLDDGYAQPHCPSDEDLWWG